MNKTTLACLMLVLWLPVAHAEIVFDEVDGAIPGEAITPLADGELDDLVGPVALYPDDLLAIMLPASTYPLQVVQAARFLDDLEANPSLTPSEGWAETGRRPAELSGSAALDGRRSELDLAAGQCRTQPAKRRDRCH